MQIQDRRGLLRIYWKISWSGQEGYELCIEAKSSNRLKFSFAPELMHTGGKTQDEGRQMWQDRRMKHFGITVGASS